MRRDLDSVIQIHIGSKEANPESHGVDVDVAYCALIQSKLNLINQRKKVGIILECVLGWMARLEWDCSFFELYFIV